MSDVAQDRLAGAPNFRDIGGYRTAGGRFLRKGVIFRAGELSNLTKQDMRKIAELGIRTIIDVRTPNERKSKPDRLLSSASLSVVHIPILSGLEDPGRLKRFLLMFKRGVDYELFTREFYDRIVFHHTGQIKKIIDIISEEANLPAVIHCVGGKDRTGVLCAFIQLFAGVSKEDVFHDYLLTNEFFLPSIEKMLGRYRWLALFRISFEGMRPLFETRQYYLEEVMDRVCREYESIENFFIAGCGTNQDTMMRLQGILQSSR